MGEHIPLLFDEVTPNASQGSRGCLSADMVKMLTTVGDPHTLHARSSDIVLSRNQARIFTSNAMSAEQWHSGLHPDVKLRPHEVLGLPVDMLAVFKRVVLVPIMKPMVKPVASASFQSTMRDGAMSAMQGLLAAELGQEAELAGDAGIDIE